jgi:hypothetical protein
MKKLFHGSGYDMDKNYIEDLIKDAEKKHSRKMNDVIHDKEKYDNIAASIFIKEHINDLRDMFKWYNFMNDYKVKSYILDLYPDASRTYVKFKLMNYFIFTPVMSAIIAYILAIIFLYETIDVSNPTFVVFTTISSVCIIVLIICRLICGESFYE